MVELLNLSTAEIARQIKSQALDPVDVTEAHIQQIQRVNPAINAIVTPMFEQAREQAQAAADHIASHGTDDLPPLFGVPVTIKDCFGVEGALFVGGSHFQRETICELDAEPVRRLREAGAIILGKTNCPDMCWSAETVNPVFGRTNNPWNLKRTAGGSSGGEAAIIAAGGSPLGLGSDIAGSVRIPAAACGIVSLKPTGGRVDSSGHIPIAEDAVLDWNTAGPMARRVEDLALALEVLSSTPVRDYRQIELDDLRASVYLQTPISPVNHEIKEAVLMSAGALQAAGVRTTRNDDLPFVPAAFAFGAIFARENIPSLSEQLGAGIPIALFDEMQANLEKRGRISMVVLVNLLLTKISGKIAGWLGNGGPDQLEHLRRRFLDQMGDVILCPVLTRPAPRHNWTYFIPFQLPYTFMFNALGFPAVCVPVGFSKDGLPLVIQVVGRPDEDETTLAVAAELERVFGGWQMPPMASGQQSA